MAVPFSYSLRNLLRRRVTTILTATGMALVVFVFASVLMLSEGLQQTLVETGSYDNVIVVRKGSTSEVVSGVEREKAAVVETQPEIANGPRGGKFAARELVVLIARKNIAWVNLIRHRTGRPIPALSLVHQLQQPRLLRIGEFVPDSRRWWSRPTVRAPGPRRRPASASPPTGNSPRATAPGPERPRTPRREASPVAGSRPRIWPARAAR